MSFCYIEPLDAKTALTLFQWNSEDGHRNEYEVTLTKVVAKGAQVALIGDLYRDDSTTSELRLMLDYSIRDFGLGVILPLDSECAVAVGPRMTLGNATCYLTLQEDGDPTYGVSFR